MTIREVRDEELAELLDAIHRGFWGAYVEAFPRLARDLARARGLDIRAINIAAEERVGHRWTTDGETPAT